jgi:hypothetical protein
LEVESELTGVIYNNELSITTLPPCGVELDEYGFPRGSGPENFVPVATTTPAPPESEPPNASQPEGLPVQNNGNGNGNGGDGDGDGDGETVPTGPPCVPVDQWLYQRDPGAAPTTVAGSTSSSDVDPDAPTTNEDRSTETTPTTRRNPITLPTRPTFPTTTSTTTSTTTTTPPSTSQSTSTEPSETTDQTEPGEDD